MSDVLDKFSNMVDQITGEAQDAGDVDENDVEPVKAEEVVQEDAESIVEAKEVDEEAKVVEPVADEEVFVDDELEEEECVEPKAEEDTYIPDFKYSVRGEEKEIPEYLRNAVTSKEQEDELRDLFTRVDGIDGIKESRDKAVSDMAEYSQKYVESASRNKAHDEYYNSLNNLIQTKDWDNFYKSAGIKEEDILNHAEEILRRAELSPDQVQAIKTNADARMNAVHITNHSNDIQSENAALQQQVADIEINTTFQTEEVSSAEKMFDERCQKAGSFRQAVGEIGQTAWNQGNKMSVLDACRIAINRYGIVSNQAAPAVEAKPKVNVPVAGVQKRTVVRNVEHIPSVKHNASRTPVKKINMDIESLENDADDYLSKL